MSELRQTKDYVHQETERKGHSICCKGLAVGWEEHPMKKKNIVFSVPNRQFINSWFSKQKQNFGKSIKRQEF